MRTCTTCGAEWPDDTRFCPSDGSSLKVAEGTSLIGGILDEKYRPKPAILERKMMELPAPDALGSEETKELVDSFRTPQGGLIICDYGEGSMIGVPNEKKQIIFDALKEIENTLQG